MKNLLPKERWTKIYKDIKDESTQDIIIRIAQDLRDGEVDITEAFDFITFLRDMVYPTIITWDTACQYNKEVCESQIQNIKQMMPLVASKELLYATYENMVAKNHISHIEVLLIVNIATHLYNDTDEVTDETSVEGKCVNTLNLLREYAQNVAIA